jgi:hypothetical protein
MVEVLLGLFIIAVLFPQFSRTMLALLFLGLMLGIASLPR